MPDFFVDDLTSDQVVTVYDWVMSQCKASENATAWHITAQKDLPIGAIHEPARAYVAGEIESFRHGLVGLSIDGIELPYLTICVEGRECMSFDYRKGPEWNAHAITALLEMFARIHELAPNARIWHTEVGCGHRPTSHFAEALLQFEVERR
ncbi:hypothetical protein GQ57_16555 [Burkholderia sp. MSh2]|nr:hypothetical protein GQ57_16555 [Burkholderia sp. MSh2]KFG93493.1 hypothetical protein GQ56_0131565 [Burkholderia paludis]